MGTGVGILVLSFVSYRRVPTRSDEKELGLSHRWILWISGGLLVSGLLALVVLLLRSGTGIIAVGG